VCVCVCVNSTHLVLNGDVLHPTAFISCEIIKWIAKRLVVLIILYFVD